MNIQHVSYADNQKETYTSITLHIDSTGLLSLSSAYVSHSIYSTFEYLMRKNRCWIYKESGRELVLQEYLLF